MIAMFLARKLTSMSFPEIGSRFGGKDHSTVISAVRKIERLLYLAEYKRRGGVIYGLGAARSGS